MRYADLYTNLNVNPISGDLMAVTDSAAISTQIKNLIFTQFYERFYNPTIGAGIPQTLFDNFGIDSEYQIKTFITEVINRYASDRAKLLKVIVNYDNLNGYEVSIVYQPLNTLDPVTLKIILKRTR